MAAHLGVASTYNLSTPAGGYTSSASKNQNIEVAEVRDENGNVVIAKPKKMISITETIRGKGDPNIAAVTAGSFAIDTIKVVSAKGTETQDDFPDFEIVGKMYSDIS